MKNSIENSLPREFGPAIARLRRVVILKTTWYEDIMEGLTKSALGCLEQHRVSSSCIEVTTVPGSFELPLAALQLCESREKPDIIIALACVIQGDTPHFSYVCEATTKGLIDVQLKYACPIGFGVLTVNNLGQAEERKNKGAEAAHAALWMYALGTK